jgi:Amidohydrolase family
LKSTNELLRQAKGEAEMILFMMSEENVALGLQRPWVMIGSDGEGRSAEGPYPTGKPHPRNYGTCPRLLGHYIRDRGLLSLPEAIRKMTSLPAAKLGLRDRGRLEPGAVADVVVFDPATIADMTTLPSPIGIPAGFPGCSSTASRGRRWPAHREPSGAAAGALSAGPVQSAMARRGPTRPGCATKRIMPLLRDIDPAGGCEPC